MESIVLATRADVDQAKAFMAYCLTGGNAGRTAILCLTTKDVIESLAHDFNWEAKARGLVRMDTDEGLAEQKALNRISIYMVAERAKQVVSALIDRFHADPEAAARLCVKIRDVPGTDGETEVTFEPKALMDLMKSLETVSNISYRALGDKVAQEADTTGAPESAASFSLAVYKALMNRWEKDAPRVVPAAEVVGKVLNVG